MLSVSGGEVANAASDPISGAGPGAHLPPDPLPGDDAAGAASHVSWLESS